MELGMVADPKTDLGLPPRTEGDARKIAATLPIWPTLECLAWLANWVHADGPDLMAHSATAAKLFGSTTHTHRVVASLKRGLFVFSLPHVHDAMRLVLLCGNEEEPPEDPKFTQILAELLLATLTTSDPAAAPDANLDVVTILPHWITMNAEQNAPELGVTVAMRLRELASMQGVLERHRAPTEAQAAITSKLGAERDLLTAAMGLLAISRRSDSPSITARTEVFPEAFRFVWPLMEAGLVISVAELRERLQAHEDRLDLIEALRRRPLIQRPDEGALVTSPLALIWWASEGIRSRMEEDLGEVEELRAKTWQLRGEAAEAALVEWVSEIDPKALCCAELRVSGEKRYGDGLDSSDLHLCCPHGAIVVELYSGLTPLRPDPDIDAAKKVAAQKSEQMIRPVRDLVAGTFERPGYSTNAPLRAVVIDDRVPATHQFAPPPIRDAVRPHAKALVGAGATSLTVMSLDDWVCAIGKVEHAPGMTIHDMFGVLGEQGAVEPSFGFGGPRQFEGVFFDSGDWRAPSPLDRDVEAALTEMRLRMFPR